MVVYLVEVQDWGDALKLVGVYSTKEKAEKRGTEIKKDYGIHCKDYIYVTEIKLDEDM